MTLKTTPSRGGESKAPPPGTGDRSGAAGKQPPDSASPISMPEEPQPSRLFRTAIAMWLVAIGMAIFFLPLYLISSAVREDVVRMDADLGAIRVSLTSVPTPLPTVKKLLTPWTQVQSQIGQVNAVYPTLSAPRTDWPAVMAAIGRYNA